MISLLLPIASDGRSRDSLRWGRDFARECFCFGGEAVNASGSAALEIGVESSCANFLAGREGKMVTLPPHIAHSRILRKSGEY